jgi:hypothetical protein
MTSHLLSPMLRRTAVVASALLTTAACSDEPTSARRAARVPPGISAVDNPDLGKNSIVPPVVDGVFGPGEYDGAATFSFRVMLPTSVPGTSMATTYITHDQTYLYIATVFDRNSPFHYTDKVGYEFDLDNDGVREDGDDILITGASGNPNVAHIGADFYRFNNGGWNQSDPVINNLSAWGVVGTKGVFETRHELNSTDDAHDMSINWANGAVSIGMQTMISLEQDPAWSNLWVHTFKPSQFTYCKLTLGKKVTSVSCP